MIPEVSIIIPMRNAELYIVQTLKSILIENEIQLEVIVIDDRSTDRSGTCVRNFTDPRVVLIEGPGQGIATCFNTGLARARGKIIMRCDADDLYPPGRIKYQFNWLESHSDYSAVCGKFATIDKKGKFVRKLNEGELFCDITDELCKGFTRTHFCTFAVRSEILRRLEGFRSFFVTGEDIDFQLRLGEQGKIWFDDMVCYYYRLHNASIVHQQHDDLRQFFEETARNFQRQRQLEGVDALQKGEAISIPCSLGANPPRTASSHIQGLLIGKAWSEHTRGLKIQAVKTGIAAIRYQPFNFTAWRNVFVLLLKSSNHLKDKG